MYDSKRQKFMVPVRRYWYYCLAYVVCTYLLTQVIVSGSDMIANAADALFSGVRIVLQSFLWPFLLLMSLGGIAAFIASYMKNSFSNNVQADIRNMLVNKLVRIQNQYFDTESIGTVMNKLQSDLYQIEALFSELIPEILVAVITIAVICIYIAKQSFHLLLVTMICYPALLWVSNKMTKTIGKVAAVRRQLYDDLESVTYDAIQGMLVGKAYNLYETQKNRIFGIIDGIVGNEVYRTKIMAVCYVMEHVIRWIPKLACYLFCLYEIRIGKVSLGTMLAYVMLLDRLAGPLSYISLCIADVREYKVSVKRLQEILDQQEEYSGTGCFKPEGEIVIELADVSFEYAADQEILTDVNMKIRRGSHVAFVGRSGSGKSTIIKLLCGFYYPKKGAYQFYGHDFKEWDISALRNNIGLVSQNVFLFSGTIAENVSFGKEGASREEIIAACIKANAHDFIMQLPQGYDTEIGERGDRLSGGQKQRISIARAFLKDAPVLLLDEPTSALDAETEQGVLDAMKRVVENRTVITVAHRVSTIADADEIYEFCDGKVIKRGDGRSGI